MTEHEILGIILEQIGICHLVKHQKLAFKLYISFPKPHVKFWNFSFTKVENGGSLWVDLRVGGTSDGLK